jgi:hypothetical protein
MSLILSGTDGLSDVDGSAATPAIRGTDANTGIFFPAADTIAFAEGGVESMRIDSAGNLGLGVTPRAWGSAYKMFQASTGASFGGTGNIAIVGSNYYNDGSSKYIGTGLAALYLQDSGVHKWFNAASGTAGNAISFTQAMTLDASGNLGVGVTSINTTFHVQGAGTTDGSIKFNQQLNSTGAYNATPMSGTMVALKYNAGGDYAGMGGWSIGKENATDGNYQSYFAMHTRPNGGAITERARIDSNGNIQVGTTTRRNNATLTISYSGTSNNGIAFIDTANANATEFLAFQNSSATNIGTVARVGTTNAVVYNTTSDQRLKSNIQNSESVIDKLMQVQVRQYDWTEGALHQDYGFIAQELEPILSGVVTKGKTDEDMWQMDYSRLTPHLLKAIQEQQAIIESLKARLDAANL